MATVCWCCIIISFFFSKFHLTIEYKKVNTSTSLAVLTEDTLMAKTSQLVFAATHGRWCGPMNHIQGRKEPETQVPENHLPRSSLILGFLFSFSPPRRSNNHVHLYQPHYLHFTTTNLPKLLHFTTTNPEKVVPSKIQAPLFTTEAQKFPRNQSCKWKFWTFRCSPRKTQMGKCSIYFGKLIPALCDGWRCCCLLETLCFCMVC